MIRILLISRAKSMDTNAVQVGRLACTIDRTSPPGVHTGSGFAWVDQLRARDWRGDCSIDGEKEGDDEGVDL